MTQVTIPHLVQIPAELRERLIELRRDIHRNPELAFQEHETAAKIERALDGLDGVTVERVADTGVVARVSGSGGGATIALRGDTDALPIHEETELDYASQKPGVMHACGHDVHATWAVGAASLLAANPAAGDVVVIFQPAEESGHGAKKMIEAGVLDGVNCIFGGHVDRRFLVGQVVADPGPLGASADTFTIELRGSGAHAARPHEAADLIVCGSQLVVSLQTIVARRLNPSAPAVLTVATFNAGHATNVIPNAAMLTGTIRATEADTRQRLIDEIEVMVECVTAAHHVEGTVRFDVGPPPLLNDSKIAELARSAVRDVLGPDSLVPLGFTNMAAEDFADYLQAVPGCFLRIGAREEGGKVIPGHSPRFYAAEDAIFVGAAVLAECARRASANRDLA